MCLGIPGKVTDSYERDGVRMGTVDFGGVRKEVCLAYVPEVTTGDYVIVHAGCAVTTIPESDARQILDYLEQMGDLVAGGSGAWA